MAERGIVNFSLASRNPWGEIMNRTVNTVLALLAAGMAGAAQGQAFPAKPIRVVIPFVAGGSSDIVGRAIAAKFQEYLGQPGVVENKPGANGSIAAEFVARADADGYTILVGSIGVFSINAALFKDLRYNPVRDFAPITLAVTTPNVLIAKPTLAANSVKELVDQAKKAPGKLAYCSSGTGSSDHLTGELLKQAAGIQAVHVPYKGGAACQTDIMGNQVDYSFQNLGAVTNYIKAGKMKALAVTAKGRHPQLPNVPDSAEAGFPDLVVTSWQAVAAPAKTPREVVAKLHDATVRALRDPTIRERMTQIGFDVVAGTPEEFGRFMKQEVDRWTAVVNKGGIKPE
jgi:tripartite-type tricarboxylate transporter receptor subunit TctC